MELSTRNQLRGKVKSVTKGSVMAEVVVALDGGQELVSVITKSSVERLGLKAGDPVTALVKATEVMIGK
jgi:molybdopterin-binding protein